MEMDWKMPSASLLVVFLVTATPLILWASRRLYRDLPPGPKPAPLIGNLHQLPQKYTWRYLHHISKQYGPIMHFDIAGKSLIVLSSIEPAHELLNRRSAQYSDRPRMVMAGEMVTKGLHLLLRPNDAAYMLHKRMEAPLLTTKSASAYQPLQDLESRQLLWDVLREGGEFGEEGIDLHHHFERAMGSFIYCLSYGFRLKTGLEQELLDSKAVQVAFTKSGQLGAYIIDTFPWLNYLPGPLAPWKAEAEKFWQLERALHVGNLEKGLRNPGWNLAKEMKHSSEGKDMDMVELAFDVGVLADAALDTSLVTLNWFIVAWLNTGSQWVSKAQTLLEAVVGRDRLPSFEDRPRLAYIDAIVYETLRWRPGIPAGVPHLNKKEDRYMDYRIPANSIVLYNQYTIARDEAVYGERTDDFDPDRWLPDTDHVPSVNACGEDINALKDIPTAAFGYGRRSCTGKNIARSQLFLQVARLLWAFEVDTGIVDKSTEKRHVVNDEECTDGFTAIPGRFPVVLRPRGQWVRDAIERSGSTYGIDHAALLDEASQQRQSRPLPL